MNLVRRLCRDQRGMVVSTELVLIAVLLVLGLIVGYATLRDQIVQEFGDTAAAVGALNQSYSFASVTVGGFTVAGSQFIDQSDFCDTGDVPGAEPECISVQQPATPEG